MKNKFKFNNRINHQIRYPEVRVLGEDNKQIGVMSSQEAFAHAQELGLDLVEIAPQALPPVVKIIELGKFKYEQEKKERAQKKNAKAGELKEVRFSPFIGDHDFDTRLERIKEFLEESSKVRIVVVFKGRQLGSKQFGYEIIGRVLKELEGKVQQDAEPKFLGKHLMTVISPVKGKKASESSEMERVDDNAASTSSRT